MYNHLIESRVPYILIDVDYEIVLSSCNVFAICGDSGSGKSTLGMILEGILQNSFTMECDRYHKWERGNKKWDEYTHLNPEANYIIKMQKDLFNLKIRNNIYQVNYNHSTGRFTDKKYIPSSDNIIVCGLHCLHIDNKNVFNVKIYMDTEETLRLKWKISRDTNSRGYSLDKIKQQIENRKEDYEKYIKPQMNNADIIVRFFVTSTDVASIGVTSLKLSLNKKYNVSKLSSILKKYGINHNLTIENEIFNSITFISYTFSSSLYKEIEYETPHLYDNFYDIIVFTIIYLHV
jgi:uridine kinase